MYRNEHEAALRRAEALEREVRDLRNRAESSEETKAQLDALQREVAGAREKLESDSERLAALEARLAALRGEPPAPAPSPRPLPSRTFRPAWALPLAFGLGACLIVVPGLTVWLSGSGETPAPPDEEVPVEHAHDVSVPADPDPHDPRPREERAREAYEEGLAAVRAGNDREALDAFERAHRLYPPMAEPHREIGLLRLKRGDVAAMCAELATYLELAPDAPDAARIREAAASVPGPQRCRLASPASAAAAPAESLPAEAPPPR